MRTQHGPRGYNNYEQLQNDSPALGTHTISRQIQMQDSAIKHLSMLKVHQEPQS